MFNKVLSRIAAIGRVDSDVNQTSDLERLKEFAESLSLVKLHFGCGPRILSGWINLDLAFEPYENYLKYYGDKYYSPDQRGGRDDFFAIDITKDKLPLENDSVDVIFHEDFIEHLGQKSQIVFLAETLRVLKPNGVHRVNTPDLIHSMKKNSNFNMGGEGVYLQEWDNHGHINVLSKASIYELAKLVGYREVIFSSRDKSRSGEMPKEYRPDPADRDEIGNIFVDLIK